MPVASRGQVRSLRLSIAPISHSNGAAALGVKTPCSTSFAGRRLSPMNSSTNDKLTGTAKEAIGKVKEAAGKVTGNPDLQDRGTAEKIEGKIQKKVGEVKQVFGK